MHAAGVRSYGVGPSPVGGYNWGDKMVELFLTGVLFVAAGGSYALLVWVGRRGR